jgi:hypothetical protein
MLPISEVRAIAYSVNNSDQEIGTNGFLGQSNPYQVKQTRKSLLPDPVRPKQGKLMSWVDIAKLPCTLYFNSRQKEPYQQLTIQELLLLFVNGNYSEGLNEAYRKEIRTVVDRIQYARKLRTESKPVYQSYKSRHIPAAVISGSSDGAHRAKYIVPNGLLCFDIDTEISEQKIMTVMSQIPYIACCFRSISNAGWAGLTYSDSIPIIEHFLCVQEVFKEHKIKLDSACKDLSRLRYVTLSPVYRRRFFYTIEKQ